MVLKKVLIALAMADVILSDWHNRVGAATGKTEYTGPNVVQSAGQVLSDDCRIYPNGHHWRWVLSD